MFKMFYVAEEYPVQETMKIIILDGHNSIGLWFFFSVGLFAYMQQDNNKCQISIYLLRDGEGFVAEIKACVLFYYIIAKWKVV